MGEHPETIDLDPAAARRTVRAIALRMLAPEGCVRLSHCPSQHVVDNVLDVAIAELEALRDPAWRDLVAGRGGTA